jgi:hypothetical protein
MRGMFKEGADNVKTFVVGYVSGGFEAAGFSIDILCILQSVDCSID